MAKLSVIIICKNEAHAIARCLQSVAWCDEIIVLDSGSGDETVDICRRYTQNVYQTDWPGFGKQKNRALSYATGEWVLSLDADEWLTPELKAEICQVIAAPRADGYWIPRLSSYCGRVIYHGSWRGDSVLRLFKKAKARFSDDAVHEKVVLTGVAARLTFAIGHESFRDLSEVLQKMDQYSTLGAQMRYAQGQRATLWQAVLHGVWSFFKSYVVKLGFLDGAEGFLLAVSTAEGSFYRYAKLRYFNKEV